MSNPKFVKEIEFIPSIRIGSSKSNCQKIDMVENLQNNIKKLKTTTFKPNLNSLGLKIDHSITFEGANSIDLIYLT
jgi:hypothetical protein